MGDFVRVENSDLIMYLCKKLILLQSQLDINSKLLIGLLDSSLENRSLAQSILKNYVNYKANIDSDNILKGLSVSEENNLIQEIQTYKHMIDSLQRDNISSSIVGGYYGKCIVTGKQIGRASCRERVCLYV